MHLKSFNVNGFNALKEMASDMKPMFILSNLKRFRSNRNLSDTRFTCASQDNISL